jgi:excinuclease ABC subunit B
VKGRVIFYGDRITDSMRGVIDETTRRRKLQTEYNQAHGIVPTAIHKDVTDGILAAAPQVAEAAPPVPIEKDLNRQVARLEKEMLAAAKNLEFEKAAELRDAIAFLKRRELGVA